MRCVYTGRPAATKPPSGARPHPRSMDLLHQDPSPGGLAGEASSSSAREACPPLMSPLGCGRAGETSCPTAPSEPWHLALAGAPRASLWPPAQLSLSVRENKFRAGCPASSKMHVSLKCGQQAAQPFKALLHLSLTSAPPAASPASQPHAAPSGPTACFPVTWGTDVPNPRWSLPFGFQTCTCLPFPEDKFGPSTFSYGDFYFKIREDSLSEIRKSGDCWCPELMMHRT